MPLLSELRNSQTIMVDRLIFAMAIVLLVGRYFYIMTDPKYQLPALIVEKWFLFVCVDF